MPIGSIYKYTTGRPYTGVESVLVREIQRPDPLHPFLGEYVRQCIDEPNEYESDPELTTIHALHRFYLNAVLSAPVVQIEERREEARSAVLQALISLGVSHEKSDEYFDKYWKGTALTVQRAIDECLKVEQELADLSLEMKPLLVVPTITKHCSVRLLVGKSLELVAAIEQEEAMLEKTDLIPENRIESMALIEIMTALMRCEPLPYANILAMVQGASASMPNEVANTLQAVLSTLHTLATKGVLSVDVVGD